MADWAREAMSSYAAARGLEFQAEGLLPAATKFLCTGLGLGPHRASIVIGESKRSVTTIGGFKKRPERATENICRGRLPGGIDGVVCHHVVLSDGYRGDHESWTAVPHTVVFAVLPESGRPVIEFHGRPAPTGDVKQYGPTIDLSGGDSVVPFPVWTEDVGGYRWRAEVAEDARLMREVASRTAAALEHAPEGTRVEYCEGALTVYNNGVVENPAVLDRMCHVAATMADALRRVTGTHEALDPRAPLRPPPVTDRSQWVDEGVRRIPWPQPPASITVAQAAYAQGVSGHARAQGRKTSAITFVAASVVFALFGLIGVGVAIAFDGLVYGVAAAIFGTLFTLPFIIAAARGAGRIMRREITVLRSRPWGIEAFARGYAQLRGLQLEDWDEFRHRFDTPIPGKTVRSFFGDLGGGVVGRLVLWISRPDQPPTYYLLAVLPAASEVPPSIPGYETYVRSGCLVIAQAVAESERSIEKLDALAAAARQAAGAEAAAPAV